MNELLYAHVDAPTPPQSLIDRAWHVKNNNIEGNVHRDLARPSYRTLIKDGEPYVNAFTNTHLFNEEEAQWVYNNVTDKFNDFRISLTTIGNKFNGPHIDITREFTLIYLLDKGGPDPATVFYREKGVEELVKPRGYCVDDYNTLTPVIRIKPEVNRWHLVNARVLHSIENIPDGRLSLQISIDTAADLDRLKYHGRVYA